MRFGVHLPLIDWGQAPFTLSRLVDVAHAVEASGLDTISANDHLVYARPWLDGPTALAAVIAAAPTPALMTSVLLPTVRGPIPTACSLAAIHALSGGRLIAGLGAGASRADFEAANASFDERWGQFDEMVPLIRALWSSSNEPTLDPDDDWIALPSRPLAASPGGPPIWIGTWGSEAGLRRVATLGDGWIASAFNTTPARFAAAKAQLVELLDAAGRDPVGFPNALVTMWLYVTADDRARGRVSNQLADMLGREQQEIAEHLPIGPASQCVEIVARYMEAGVDRIVFWPIGDEVRHVEALATDILPSLGWSP